MTASTTTPRDGWRDSLRSRGCGPGGERVAVIGAGVGGLAAAVDLARQGAAVTVFEAAAGPGGKMRAVQLDGQSLDAGPTVLTMRDVFDQLFADAGAHLDSTLRLRQASILARHAWSADEQLDLFADLERSVDAIAAFACPAEARRFREFSAHAQRIYEALNQPFMRSAQPSALALLRRSGLPALAGIAPFTTLWRLLGRYFHDPRLRQLFGRYATYMGSSPFAAPATLMLIAHVERSGVWMIDGGMRALAGALEALALRQGAVFRYQTPVAEIVCAKGRVRGLRLLGGETLDFDAVVFNGDAAALSTGLLGIAGRQALPPRAPAPRSLSAITWLLRARVRGCALLRHNVFFSADYVAEFAALAQQRPVPAAPTVYVCAQDRLDDPLAAAPEWERLLVLINAPAVGDSHSFSPAEIDSCAQSTFSLLERCGLQLALRPHWTKVTTPNDFAQQFPATGGALYGAATEGWMASFQRPQSRTRMPGLYLAGGSVHPGPGVPMAALSGRLAAASLLQDFSSKRR